MKTKRTRRKSGVAENGDLLEEEEEEKKRKS